MSVRSTATVSRRRGWWALPVIALLAIAAAAMAPLTRGSATEAQVIHAEFERTFNLFEGSRVRVLGVAVGTVETVEFSSGTDRVHVTLRVDHDVRLPADVQASIVFGSLLGERHVELHPPHTGGPVLESGARIPMDRTSVPAEFDEVLESLNEFLAALPPDEVARLITNAADVLDGQGAALGTTIDDVSGAVAVLRDNDEEIVALTRRLADLNSALATRDREIAALIRHWNEVLASLAEEREALDAALDGLLRMSVELHDLLDTHREDLETDVATLTRVGRTIDRNMEQVDLLLLGQSELFRHAERVFNREKNWLPLVNVTDVIFPVLADRLTNRLVSICDRLGIAECASLEFWDPVMPAEVCFPGVVPCPGEAVRREDGSVAAPTAIAEAIATAVDAVPELPELLRAERQADAEPDASCGPIRRLFGTLTRSDCS